jgi:arylsulfatase
LQEFVYDGGGPGKGATVKLTIDGKPAGETRVERTMPFIYSADEGVDVGTDNETTVTNDYKPGANKFTGRIVKVTVEQK